MSSAPDVTPSANAVAVELEELRRRVDRAYRIIRRGLTAGCVLAILLSLAVASLFLGRGMTKPSTTAESVVKRLEQLSEDKKSRSGDEVLVDMMLELSRLQLVLSQELDQAQSTVVRLTWAIAFLTIVLLPPAYIQAYFAYKSFQLAVGQRREASAVAPPSGQPNNETQRSGPAQATEPRR